MSLADRLAPQTAAEAVAMSTMPVLYIFYKALFHKTNGNWGEAVDLEEQVPELVKTAAVNGVKIGDIIQDTVKEFPALATQLTNLPGHAKEALPRIQKLHPSPEEFLLLLELTKSAVTRSMIEKLKTGQIMPQILSTALDDTVPEGTRRRIGDAVARWRRNLPPMEALT